LGTPIIRAKISVAGNCSKISLRTTRSGTESIIPGMPQINPQKTNPKITVIVLMLILEPIIIGSITEPISICTPSKISEKRKIILNESSVTSAIVIGKIVEMKAPTFGI
jgi:hypothetical protein